MAPVGKIWKNLLLSVLQLAFETSRLCLEVHRFPSTLDTTSGFAHPQDVAFVVLRLLASCVLHICTEGVEHAVVVAPVLKPCLQT